MNAVTRASRALAVALGAALALAGCGGIPTTGPVIAGPAVDAIDPDYVVTPNGPVPDADPAGILAGFMRAVRSPQADYAVARQFLTAELAMAWDPYVGVLIRTDAAVPVEVGTEAAPVIEYSFPTRASVDAAGRYREADVTGTRTLEFEFAQVDGQWRISAAPDGVVLADVSFERAFADYPLYFFDPSGRYLVPDVRWFPSRQNTPSLVVAALLAGPDEWLAHAVVSVFPPGTTLGSRPVTVSGGRAEVDLGPQIASASPGDLDRMRQQLIATLDVASVTITAEGIPLPVQAAGPAATRDPAPSGSVLLGTPTEFGHASPNGIVPIPGVTEAVVADGAVGVTLDRAQTSAAYLVADGSVRRVADGVPAVLDTRPGLVVPSLDEFGWTWSAGDGSPIEAFGPDGTAAGLVTSAVPGDAAVVALALSRDSTRLAVGLRSPDGPRLLVFGVVRSGDAPTSLDPPLELPATGPIGSLAWVDDRSLVVVADAAVGRTAQVVGLGAPGESLGALPPGGVAVGGRGGVAGIRALADGLVLSPGGSDGWTEAGVTAGYLGVQQ